MSQIGTFAVGGSPGGPVSSFTTDIGGPVIPVLGVVDVTGAANQLQTTGAGNVLTIGIVTNPIIAGTVTALGFQTSNATTSVTILNNGIFAGGSNAIVDVSISPKGGGALSLFGISAGYNGSSWRTEQRGVQTTDATVTPIISLPLPDSEMITIKAYVNGFRNTFTDCIGAEVLITAYRPPAGNVTLAGDPIVTIITPNLSTLSVTATVDVGTQAVRVNVVGIVAETFNWVTSYQYFYTITNA